MLTKVKEVSKRLITGGLLCIAIGLVGIAGIVIGVIMLLFIWLINMVNKL